MEEEYPAIPPIPVRPAPSDATPSLPSIRLWLAALNVVALLALTGFIVKFAQEQFLGTSFLEWGPAELSTLSGRFLIDTILLTFQWVILHPGWSSLWFALTLAVIAISFEFPVDSRSFRIARNVTPICILIALLAILVRVQLPLIPVEGWLTTSLTERLPEPASQMSATAPVRVALTARYFSSKTRDLDRTIFLSRASGIGACYTRTEKASPRVIPGLPQSLLAATNGSKWPTLKGDSDLIDWMTVAANAEAAIQSLYVHEVLVCLLAWVVLWLNHAASPKDRLDATMDFVRFALAFCLLPICTLFVPFSYGKLISSTQFTRASVQFKLGEPDPLGTDRYLIERNDSTLSLLSLAANVPQISVIRTGSVASLNLSEKVDVLQVWNNNCWFNPPAVVTPPPSNPKRPPGRP